MTAPSTMRRRRLPSRRDGDFTKSVYRDDMIALFSLLRRRGVSPAEIAMELRSGPIPVVDGPALELADDLVGLQNTIAADAKHLVAP
jgi:hypothetical protein